MRDELVLGIVNSEIVFVGACLTRPELLDEVFITPDDFDSPIYGLIFARMLERHHRNMGVSQALLSEDFPNNLVEVWSCTDSISEMAAANSHQQAIRDQSVRRKLHAASIRIAAIAASPNMEDIVDRARAEVDTALRGDETKVVSMLHDVRAVLAEYRTEIDLTPSPWADLNEIIGGFGPGRMYVIGARPGVGKSAIASQIAYLLASTGPVIFATMEMSKGELYSRILSQQAELYYGNMNAAMPDFAKQREDAWISENLRDIRVLDSGTQTVSSIRAAARSASHDGKLAGIVVDYIHLLSGDGDNEVARISNITRALKQLSMDLKVPIIALSQLNRAVTSRESGKPGLGDLRSSGSIEQDADAIVFLYKDIGVGETTANDEIQVYVAKNRQGPSFVGFTLEWQGEFVRAVDAPQGWEQ